MLKWIKSFFKKKKVGKLPKQETNKEDTAPKAVEKLFKKTGVKLALILFFFASNLYADTTNQFVVNRYAYDVVKQLSEQSGELPEYLPKELFAADVSVHVYAKPQQHYYKFTINLDTPVNKLVRFNKVLEIWALPDKTIFKSSVGISYGKERHVPLRWVNKVKHWILNKVECAILMAEQKKILELARNK